MSFSGKWLAFSRCSVHSHLPSTSHHAGDKSQHRLLEMVPPSLCPPESEGSWEVSSAGSRNTGSHDINSSHWGSLGSFLDMLPIVVQKSLWECRGREMAQVAGSLPSVWEIWIAFLALSLSPAKSPCGCSEGEPVDRSTLSHSFHPR